MGGGGGSLFLMPSPKLVKSLSPTEFHTCSGEWGGYFQLLFLSQKLTKSKNSICSHCTVLQATNNVCFQFLVAQKTHTQRRGRRNEEKCEENLRSQQHVDSREAANI